MSDNYVVVYNVMCEGENKMTPNELYLYFYLRLNVRWAPRTKDTGEYRTNITHLANDCKIYNHSRSNVNKVEMKKSLLSLEEKGYVSIRPTMELESKDYDSSIAINIVDCSQYAKQGYFNLYIDDWDLVNKPDELFILAMIEKYNGHVSYSRFAHAMDKSDKYIKTLINDLVDKSSICKITGKYIGKNVQDVNFYVVNRNIDIGNISKDEYEDGINWFIRGSTITDDDIRMALLASPEFKEKIEFRLDNLRQNKKFEEQYQRIAKEINREMARKANKFDDEWK